MPVGTSCIIIYILMYRYYLVIQLLQRWYVYIYIIVFAVVVFEIGLPGRLLVDRTVPVELL